MHSISFWLLISPAFCYDVYQVQQNVSLLTNLTVPQMLYNFINTAYETQFWGIGVSVPSGLYFSDYRMPAVTIAMYLSLVVVITIIVMNTMIGLFSDHISKLNQHKDSIIILQKLSVHVLAAEAVQKSKVIVLILKIMKRLNPRWLTYILEKQHILNNEDGTVALLHVIE
jgi:hypothetical protein